jgi:hypothetical protein
LLPLIVQFTNVTVCPSSRCRRPRFALHREIVHESSVSVRRTSIPPPSSPDEHHDQTRVRTPVPA